jgi:hypothetical protein
MAADVFKVGDCVRARTSGVVPAGTRGIIRQTLYMVSSSYMVLFDGWTQVRLMHANDLERVTDGRKRPPTA